MKDELQLGVSNIQMRRAGSWWTCRRARRRSCRWAARAWSWPGMAPGPAVSCKPRWRGPPRWCPWTARTAGSAAPGCPAHPRTGRISRPLPRTTWSAGEKKCFQQLLDAASWQYYSQYCFQTMKLFVLHKNQQQVKVACLTAEVYAFVWSPAVSVILVWLKGMFLQSSD